MTDPYPSDPPAACPAVHFEPIPWRDPPDVARCRARQVPGQAGLVDCLVAEGARCPYALSFGYGFLCNHPQRDEIIARTD